MILAFGTVAICLAGFSAPTTGQVAPTTPKVPRSLGEGLALHGVILAPDGTRVKKAVVLAKSRRWNHANVLVGIANAGGLFVLHGADAPPYDIAIDAPGFAPRRIEGARPGSRFTARLKAGSTIEGIVRDGVTGGPAPGARVEVKSSRATQPSTWEYRDFGLRYAITDRDGRYETKGLETGRHSVSAWLRGAGHGCVHDVRAGNKADIVLKPTTAILGIVLGAHDMPIAGASVVAVPRDNPSSGSRSSTTTSRADGKFELFGLDPGDYALFVWHRSHATAMVPATATSNEEAEVDVVLARGLPLQARLIDSKGRPVRGSLSVVAIDGTSLPKRASLLASDVEAEADGTVRLGNAPPGRFTLEARGPGFSVRRLEISASFRDPAIDAGDIVLEQGLTMHGRVRTQRGGLPNILVSAYRIGGDGRPVETLSEADGRFTLGGLEDGAYLLGVRATGFGPTNKTAEAGAEGVDIVLSVGGAITGWTVDSDGAPLTSYVVHAQPQSLDDDSGWSLSADQYVESQDARFNIEGLSSGTYVVVIDAPDHSRVQVPNVRVTSGTTVDLGRVRLRPGGTVSGTITDERGNGIAGATARVDEAGVQIPARSLEAVTDIRGAFELKGLAPGTATLRGMHPDFAVAETVVAVDAEQPLTDVRLTLGEGGRIAGKVTRRDGAALSGISVVVTPAGGSTETLEEPVNEDGSYTVERVPPGRATVSLAVGTGIFRAMRLSRETEARSGETSIVDFSIRNIRVSGRVLRGGTPAAGFKVRFMQGGAIGVGQDDSSTVSMGPTWQMAATRDDGSYALLLDEPGTNQLAVQGPDGTRYPPQTVAIPDTDEFSYDVSLPGVRISGTVVDKDTGAALPRAFFSVQPKDSNAEGGRGLVHPTETNADGQFDVELDPGPYQMTAHATGYLGETISLNVVHAAEIRIPLGRGLAISGRVLAEDASTHGMVVNASSPLNDTLVSATVSPDGSFRIGGLRPGLYYLEAHRNGSLVAPRVEVEAGTDNVILPPL